MMKVRRVPLTLAFATSLAGCGGAQGARARYVDPSETGPSGSGIESQDIRTMTDRMARDILASPQVAGLTRPPYVIVDDQFFSNESAAPINKRMITERLMVELNRAASGRMFFVERQAEDMVRGERSRKRAGEVGAGSQSPTEKVAGADYRLTGRIMSQDAVNLSSGADSRYHQVVFKLVDLESGLAVWSNMYEMKKESTADVVYR